jgi:PAS domain S-box-containing protein
MDWLKALFSANGFIPHGHCYAWRPGVLWLNVVSNALIALSCATIPFTLLYFARKRRDLPFHWVLVCLAVFIIACGATHAMEIWTLWTPVYWLSGIIKAIMALASVPAAILLVRLLPAALASPGAAALRASNEAVVASAALFRALLESAADAMVIVDKAGRIFLINAQAEALFGHGRAELLGKPAEILIPERLRARHAANLAGFFGQPRRRDVMSRIALSGLRKDGSEFPTEISLSPIDTPEGLFTLASIIDITERKRTEDELRRSNAELEQFAYIASHDLQEPLRMVASYTELLGQRYRGKLDDKADTYIHYAVDGAKRMQRLVADLLAYSRVGSQGKRMVPVSIAAVVNGVLEVLSDPIRSAGAVVEAAGLPDVFGDEGQLRQLFQNLIGNALKFRGSLVPHIVVGARLQGEHWEISVRDNGIGIEIKYAERIFEMFQRLHERGKYEGSGIGLSIAKRIVERHGGRIWLESRPGEGTTFFFTLRAGPVTELGSRA